MRALGALVLAFAMLLKAEAAGLADQRINQGVKQAMASLADNRPVVLAKMGYVTYAAGAAMDTQLMSFTFPAASLAIGDQIHVSVSGLFINNSGGVYQAGYLARFTGGNAPTILDIGGPALAPSAGTDYAFKTDIYIAVSIPNASGVYIPSTGINPSAQSSQLYANRPNTSIAFTGTGVTIIGNGNFFGPSFGGIVQGNPATFNGSEIFTVKFQQVFDASQPIRLDIRPVVPFAPTGATSYFAVHSGYVIGM